MSEAAQGFEYGLEHNSDSTVPSSLTFQHELMPMEEGDSDDDDDGVDDNGKEKLGIAEDAGADIRGVRGVQMSPPLGPRNVPLLHKCV